MNALCYKIVFSKRLGALVAVGEHTSGQGKAAGTGVRTAAYPSSAVGAKAGEFVGSLKAVFASVALTCFTATTIAAGQAANTLPTGYNVNSGNVAVSTSGANMTIKQTTDKASVNWQSFSIGSAASVNIQQNSASSVLLNRVVGNDPSQIFGKLTANGQVILINPNGIVFGKGGSVTASAFTASTFGLSDQDFAKGKYNYTRNGSIAGVTVEDGTTISTTAPAGYVALIGASVDNQGTISTKQGTVVLAAGESVALPTAMTDNISVPLSGKVRLELQPSTINAMVSNSGTITTDSGQVLMQAAAVSDAVASITHTGTIDTTGEQGGAVTLQADHGIIKATGTIKASSKNAKNKGGDIIIGRDEVPGVLAASADVSGANLESQGGFVETSGQYLKTDGIKVKAKEWLLDPSDITISSGNDAGYSNSGGTYTPDASAATSVVKVDTIQTAISNGTSVTITTTNTGTKGAGAGNITINDALTFTNNSDDQRTLTLIADNGIIVNKDITTNLGTGSGLVDISMTAKGNYNGTDAANANSKGITINSTISTNGDVTLDGTSKSTSSDSVRFGDGAGITAAKITVTGNAGVIPATGANYSGIGFNGTNVFESTGSNTSTFKGTSSTTSNTSAGIMASDGAKLTLVGNIELDGINTNTSPFNRGLRIGGAGGDANVTTTVGNVTFKNSEEKSQVLLRGKLTATGTVSFKGGSYVDIYGGTTITANSGTTINLESQRVQLGDYGGASIRTDGAAGAGYTLNIRADQLNIRTQAGSESTINTGTGTLNINTYTPGQGILLGAADVTTGTTKLLGVDDGELNRITTSSLVIGDNTAGLITVAGAISVKNNTTLQTGNEGGIASTAAGKIALTANKTLTLNTSANATSATAGSMLGVISSASGSTIAKTGAGYVRLKGAQNASSGNGADYIVSGGTLGFEPGADSSFVNFSANSVTVDGASTFNIDAPRSGNSVASWNTSTINLNNGATFKTNTSNILLKKNLTINASGNSNQITSNATFNDGGFNMAGNIVTVNTTEVNDDLRFAAPLWNSGALKKTGAGTVTYLGSGVSGSTNYTTTAIAGGTLQIGEGTAYGTLGSENVTLSNDANLKLKLSVNTTISNQITGKGNVSANITSNFGMASDLTVNSNNFNLMKGTIDLTADGNITVENNLSADGDIKLKAKGDVTVGAAISQAGAGNIVIAAGLGKGKGDGTGVGQVKRSGSGTVSNTIGNTYIYTGEVATSAKMSDLNSTEFGTLTLGTNAQSNTDTDITKTITGSAAKTQVMYREKIKVDLTDKSNSNGPNNNLNATTTYGSVGKANVDADAKGILKTANNDKTLTWSENGNNFSLSSNALIDTLSMSGLSNSSYSSADKLKASSTPYTTESTTYSVATDKTLPTLEVTQKLINTASIAGVSDAVYGTSKTTGEVTLGTDVIAGDKVAAANTATVQNPAYSSSGNLKAGSYSQTVASGVTSTNSNDDASNYSFAGTTTTDKNYIVAQKVITTANIAGVGDAVYGTSKTTGEVTLGTDVIAGDKVAAANTATVQNPAYSSSGNLKAGSYKQTVAAGVTSTNSNDDASNYSFAGKTTDTANYVVAQKSLTALYAASDKVFDGNTTATILTASLQDAAIKGDSVALANTSANFDSSDVGTGKTVTVGGISLTGADAANYSVASTALTTNKPSITAVPVPPPSPAVPTGNANRVKVPVGTANPFALASAEDLADDTCTANSIENCYCEPSELNKQVDICYEPKAGAKGSAR